MTDPLPNRREFARRAILGTAAGVVATGAVTSETVSAAAPPEGIDPLASPPPPPLPEAVAEEPARSPIEEWLELEWRQLRLQFPDDRLADPAVERSLKRQLVGQYFRSRAFAEVDLENSDEPAMGPPPRPSAVGSNTDTKD